LFLYFALTALAVFLFLLGIQKRRKDAHWETYRKTSFPEPQKRIQFTDDLLLAGLNLDKEKLFLVGVVGAIAGAIAVIMITGKPGFAILGLAAGLFAPKAWTNYRINARRHLFQGQLESTLNLMAAALRAGASELQAWEQASLAAPFPTRDVLEYVIRLNRSGRSLAVSLEEASKRTESRDLQVMAAATALCVQTGGDLAAVYDRLGDSIREKQTFQSQVEGLMAEGTMSANVLAMLPFAFIAVFRHLSPQYMAPLFNEALGNIVFLVCSVMILIGWTVLRNMSRVDY